MKNLFFCALLTAATSFNANAGFDEAFIAHKAGNFKEAVDQCFQDAKAGDGNCMSLIGQMYAVGVGGLPLDVDKAFEWLRAAAQTNARRAQFFYGLAFLNGVGVPKDTKRAVEFFAKSSAQGYSLAHVSLAWQYLAGEVVEQDAKKAFELGKAAAAEGLPAGHALLGYMLSTGLGIPTDHQQAANHYLIAAEQGDAYALNMLGLQYCLGEGVAMNYVVAYVLFDLAAARNYEDAPHNLALLDGSLTKEQIDEAKSLSSGWKVGDKLPSNSKTWVQPSHPSRLKQIPVPRQLLPPFVG